MKSQKKKPIPDKFNPDVETPSDISRAMTPTKRAISLMAAHKKNAEISIYTGKGSEERWDLYFKQLAKNPTSKTKAAMAAGFTAQTATKHVNLDPDKRALVDELTQAYIDKVEDKIDDKIFNSQNENVSLKATEIKLNAYGKERGYGNKMGGLNVFGGGKVQININTDIPVPTAPEEDTMEIKNESK